jgi:hypothetical protein
MEPGICYACEATNIENGFYSECPNCGKNEVRLINDVDWDPDEDGLLAYERYLEDRGWMDTLQEETERARSAF